MVFIDLEKHPVPLPVALKVYRIRIDYQLTVLI